MQYVYHSALHQPLRTTSEQDRALCLPSSIMKSMVSQNTPWLLSSAQLVSTLRVRRPERLESRGFRLYGDTDSFTCFWMTQLSHFKTASTKKKHSNTFWLLEQGRQTGKQRRKHQRPCLLSLVREDIYSFTLFLLQELLRTQSVLTPTQVVPILLPLFIPYSTPLLPVLFIVNLRLYPQ